MKGKWKSIFTILICISLAVGTIIICVIGENRIRNTTKKNIINATEVYSETSGEY